jgi:uncharacterized protein YgiM (DUF1202 family)
MFRNALRTSFFCAIVLGLLARFAAAAAQVDENPTGPEPAETAAPAPAPALEQPAPAPAGARPGEVTANDVYVRSGDSTNHYTICKLNAGDRVTIVSERGDWYEILPPPGTFSLVSGDYVDSADGKAGIINGDNVRVRAGSLLNDNKYTVQAMLSKGDTVTILGPNPEGFLRIQPPPQATLWISKQFVQPPGAGAIMANVPPQTTSTTSTKETAAGAQIASPVGAGDGPSKPSSPGPLGGTKWRDELREIDTATKEQLAKTPTERDLSGVIAQYRPISEQTEDDYAKQYALARLSELENMHALKSAIENVRGMGEQAEAKRREFLEGRATIPQPETEPVPAGVEIQGELRVSALYPPGSSVRRFRLIDPAAERDRTLAYVEIPQELPLKVEDFIGKYVGVRASERRLQQGGVNPIPIYIVTELILMQPPKLDSAQASSKNTP